MTTKRLGLLPLGLTLAAASGCARGATETLDSGPAPGRDAAPWRDAAVLTDARPEADRMPVPDGGCPAGLTDCGGVCVDLQSDHGHCGSCNSPCSPNEACLSGRCEPNCPAGRILCDGECVDPETDPEHCGDCATRCTAGSRATPVCRRGVCGIECDPGWSDLDGDGSCESPCEPNASETCNGQDDDCDGVTDEDFDCVLGAQVGCTTSCGSLGTGTCGTGCVLPGPSQCVPPQEQCNGQDDDCDGACDDGFECCAGAAEACTTSCGSQGTRTCSANCTWSACVPPQEECNGRDDDCDGATDEDFVVYQCPLTGQTNPDRSACEAACSQSAACQLQQVTVSGSVRLRDCDFDYNCNPNYFISLLKGNGNTIEVYGEGGLNMNDILVDTLTLAGTRYECPLDASLACSGNPPECTRTASCEPVTVCE